jgi:hypothetical protein
MSTESLQKLGLGLLGLAAAGYLGLNLYSQPLATYRQIEPIRTFLSRAGPRQRCAGNAGSGRAADSMGPRGNAPGFCGRARVGREPTDCDQQPPGRHLMGYPPPARQHRPVLPAISTGRRVPGGTARYAADPSLVFLPQPYPALGQMSSRSTPRR